MVCGRWRVCRRRLYIYIYTDGGFGPFAIYHFRVVAVCSRNTAWSRNERRWAGKVGKFREGNSIAASIRVNRRGSFPGTRRIGGRVKEQLARVAIFFFFFFWGVTSFEIAEKRFVIVLARAKTSVAFVTGTNPDRTLERTIALAVTYTTTEDENETTTLTLCRWVRWTNDRNVPG